VEERDYKSFFVMNDLNILQNLKIVESYPYPHIIIENALPEKIYNELLKTLPEQRIDQQLSRDEHDKRTWHVLEMKEEKWPISNIWKEFIKYHCSKEFFFDVLNIFNKWNNTLPIIKEKIKVLDRSKNENTNTSSNAFTDFSIVKHPAKNNVPNRLPHLDNNREIYAGLLYLKHPNDNSTGGGFAIHKAEDLITNEHLDFNNPGPVVKVCPYKSNQFVMFWNTNNSQHSVESRQNAEYPRWSVNMLGRFMGYNMFKENVTIGS
jgi:hypothetical protein